MNLPLNPSSIYPPSGTAERSILELAKVQLVFNRADLDRVCSTWYEAALEKCISDGMVSVQLDKSFKSEIYRDGAV